MPGDVLDDFLVSRDRIPGVAEKPFQGSPQPQYPAPNRFLAIEVPLYRKHARRRGREVLGLQAPPEGSKVRLRQRIENREIRSGDRAQSLQDGPPPNPVEADDQVSVPPAGEVQAD